MVRLSLSFVVISLWLLSVLFVSLSVFIWLEAPFIQQASPGQQIRAGAVVFLGSGRLRSASEFGDSDQLSQYALWRIGYSAYLGRKRVDVEGDSIL